MLTVRQIERLWAAKDYTRLLRALTEARPEASARLEEMLSRPIPAAAMLIIRLDELNQSGAPIASRIIHTLVTAQNPDGGWGDPMTTALALRALRCGNGAGYAIDRALDSLADLQKPEGIWPASPIRRLPEDPYASAFILFQLGRDPRFRAAVRFDDALNWFATHEGELEPEARRLWDRAATRCRHPAGPDHHDAVIAGGSGSCSTMSTFRRAGSGPIVCRFNSYRSST